MVWLPVSLILRIAKTYNSDLKTVYTSSYIWELTCEFFSLACLIYNITFLKPPPPQPPTIEAKVFLEIFTRRKTMNSSDLNMFKSLKVSF